MISYFIPDMPTTDQLIPYLREIDNNCWYTNFGPLHDKFKLHLSEKIFKDIDPNRITLVSTGTSAIELALKSLNLPAGVKVLTSCFTFPATIEAIINVGLVPIISDVDKENWLLTPAIAEHVISLQDIAAVIPVAAFGMPICSESWANFNKKTGLPVIIDSAAGLINQTVNDQLIYTFSLHATKPIGAGEGGIVICPTKEQAIDIQKTSNFGFDPNRIIGQLGTNAKLSEYHCAVGLASIDRLNVILNRRSDTFGHYKKLLIQNKLPLKLQARTDSFIPANLYVLFDNLSADFVFKKLLSRNIETRRLYYPLINEHPAFEDINYASNEKPDNALALSERGLALPFHTHLTFEEIEIVVNALAEILTA